jgi:hypothetical protein
MTGHQTRPFITTYIQFDGPDGVVAAILEVVSEVRSDPPRRTPDHVVAALEGLELAQ